MYMYLSSHLYLYSFDSAVNQVVAKCLKQPTVKHGEYSPVSQILDWEKGGPPFVTVYVKSKFEHNIDKTEEVTKH